MAKPISSLVNVTEYLSKKKKTWGDIQRDNSRHSCDITSNVSSASNPKSSWFKIEPPSTSLVTTACKLKPLRSKGTNPETKGTLSTTAELKSCRNASTLRLTSSRCNKENRLENTRRACHRVPRSTELESEQFPTIDFFFLPSWQTYVCLGLFIFICMYLHLPLIFLLRPLSVPRTLPHPLQIRFQRRHTPRGEKPRDNWGLEQQQVGRPVSISSDRRSWAFPQHDKLVQVYKRQACLYEKKRGFLACPC